MDISYIIGHRGNVTERLRNLKMVLQWIKQFDFEVIIVEQDDTPKIQELVETYGYKYIFAKNNGIYNRSWGLNIGIKQSTKNVIVCADNDMIIDKTAVFDCYDQCNKYDAVSPFQSVIDLTENETIGFPNISVNRLFRSGMNLSSGIVFFKRQCIFDIGLWDESFRGWGGEDDAICFKLSKLEKKTITRHHICYHLYHSRTKYDMNIHENYGSNISVLTQIVNQSKEQLILNRSNISEMGNIHKYES